MVRVCSCVHVYLYMDDHHQHPKKKRNTPTTFFVVNSTEWANDRLVLNAFVTYVQSIAWTLVAWSRGIQTLLSVFLMHSDADFPPRLLYYASNLVKLQISQNLFPFLSFAFLICLIV